MVVLAPISLSLAALLDAAGCSFLPCLGQAGWLEGLIPCCWFGSDCWWVLWGLRALARSRLLGSWFRFGGPRCLTIEWEEEETWTAGFLRTGLAGFRAGWFWFERHSGGHGIEFIAFGILGFCGPGVLGGCVWDSSRVCLVRGLGSDQPASESRSPCGFLWGAAGHNLRV